MTLYELLLTRRSVVASKMVAPGPNDQELADIIEVGLCVPDHGKIGPWRIQIVNPEAQARLGDIYADLYRRDNPDAKDEVIEIQRKRPKQAPRMIVVTSYPDRERAAKIPLIEQVLSGGALCQNLLNGAYAKGFVAQWVTGWPAYHAGVKAALGHRPDTDILGFIFIGSAMHSPSKRHRYSAGTVTSEWTGPT